MKKFLLIPVLLLLMLSQTIAEEHTFRKDFSFSMMDLPGRMIETSSGNFVFCGTNMTFLPISGNVTKLDPMGNVIWSIRITASFATHLTDIIEVSQALGGGFLVTGEASPGTVLIRLDNSGNPIWSRRYQYPNDPNGPGSSEWFNRVIETSDGYFLACGAIKHLYDELNDIRYDSVMPFATKINPANGDLEWDRAFVVDDIPDDDGHRFYDLTETADGYIFVGSSSVGEGTLNDNGNYPSNGLIIKTDFNGNLVDARRFGSVDRSEAVESIITTSTGDALLTGIRGEYAFLMRINGTGATPTINFGHRYRHAETIIIDPPFLPPYEEVLYTEPVMFFEVQEMSDGNYGTIGTYFNTYELPFNIYSTATKINSSNGEVIYANTFSTSIDDELDFNFGLLPKGGVTSDDCFFMFMQVMSMGTSGYDYHVLKTNSDGSMNNDACPEGEYNPHRSGYTPSLNSFSPIVVPRQATDTDFIPVITPLDPTITVMCQYLVCDAPDNPIASANPEEICEGESSTISASGSGDVTYHYYTQQSGGEPFASGTSVVVSPTETTTYYVEAESNDMPGCFSQRTPVTIEVISIPDITITPAGPFSYSDDAVELAASPAGGTWSGSGIVDEVNGTFDPAQANIGDNEITYQITVGECSGSESITIQVLQGEINAVLDYHNHNCGIPGYASITIIESCSGNPTVSWSTGDTGLEVDNLEGGSYSVTVSDDNCEDLVLEFTIEETEIFDVTIVMDDYDECDSFVTLIAEVDGAEPQNVTFEWNNNSSYNNQSFVATSSGTYIVNAQYGFCRLEDEILVTLNATPNVFPVDNVSVCASYTFPEIIGTNLTGNEAYYTQPGGTGESFESGNTINFNTFNPEDYPVTIYIYDAAGSCYDEESFELTIYQQPVIEIVNMYCDESGISYNVELAETPGSISSTSGTVDGFSIINILVGTDIVITVENFECSATLEVDSHNCSCDYIEVPQAENPVSQEICFGQENPAISVQTPQPTSDYQIIWYDVSSGGMPLIIDSETFTPSVTQPGVYTYYAEVQEIQSSCKSQRVAVEFTIFDNPVISGSSIICEIGESVQLSVSGGSGTPHSVTPWESSNDAVATVNNGLVQAVSFGDVVITYMDSNACSATRNISVTDNCDNLFSISGKAMYAGRVHPHPVNGTQYDEPIYTLDSVMIVLKDNNNNEVDSYFTGTNGEFTFTGIQPGEYTIEYYKVYNELSSWVNSVNVTDYTWFKTYVLNHYDDYYSFLRFDDLYWYAMNVTCEQPPLWNVADYNQIKYKILNFSNYEVYEPFINNPNTFCYGAWQDGSDEIVVTDHDITDHICLLIVYGDYNASAQGYVHRETGTNVHNWDENNKSSLENFISESAQTVYSDGKEVTIPMYISSDYFNLAALQLQILYPHEDFNLKSIELNDIYKNSTIKSKMNIEYEEFISANHELVSTDYNGIINLIYAPDVFSNFNFITNKPVLYLTFENKNANINIENDLKLFGTSNILLNSKFQEFENVGFEIPKIVYSPTNIDNHSFTDIKLYPNPARDFLNLEFYLNKSKEIQISVIDVTGRTVLTLDKVNYYSGNNKVTIPVSELSKGYYSLEIIRKESDQSQVTHKMFIIN